MCNRFRKHQLIPAILITLAVTLVAGLGGCGSSPQALTIGVINISPGLDPVLEGFKAGMADLDYIEGENVTYAYEGATGSLEGLAPVAEKLVKDGVDLILAIGTPSSIQAKAFVKGSSIPVVFVPVYDPVASGLVESLAHPGGDLTGIRAGGFVAKNLEWLMALAPDTKRLYVPHNPNDKSSVQSLNELKETASKLGVEVMVHEAATPQEMASAATTAPKGVDGIFLLPDNLVVSHFDDFANLALQGGLPMSTVDARLVKAGVLMSYGVDFFRLGDQAARLAGKVLQGTPPSSLPVETAEFFLSINLVTASSISLDIGEEFLQRAETIVR